LVAGEQLATKRPIASAPSGSPDLKRDIGARCRTLDSPRRLRSAPPEAEILDAM
jgi:hypothetical protein